MSNNWSGYAKTGGPYTSVTGEWVVPSVATGNTASSAWIGIDGWPSGNNNLIQVGTSQNGNAAFCGNAYYAWWQIIPDSNYSTCIPTNQLTVTPGDLMSASITKTSGSTWLISIADLSTQQTFSISKSYSGPTSSVEWIMEEPCAANCGSSGGTQATMAHYSTFGFYRGTVNGGNPALTSANSIVLNDNGAVLSSPSAPNSTSDGFAVAYGATPPAVPTVTTPSLGAYDAFSVNTGHYLAEDIFDGSWSGLAPVAFTSTLYGVPSVVFDPDDGTFHAYAINSAGTMMQNTWSYGWQGWQSLGGTLQGGASAVYENLKFHVFAISGTGNLYERTWNGSWGVWQNIGNPGTVLQGTPAAVYDPDDNTFHVFALTSAGATYQITWNSSSSWGVWQPLGGMINDGLSAVYENGEFHVFGIAPSGNLFHLAYVGSWQPWQNLGGTVGGAAHGVPGSTYNPADGTFHVFAIGGASGNGPLVQTTYSSSAWHAWQNLGGSLLYGVSALS